MSGKERKKIEIEKLDKKMAPGTSAGGLTWHAPREAPFQLAGFAWFERDRVYRRLPVQPREKLPESVDHLANCTAGGQIRFQSNTRRVAVRVQLRAAAGMNHMPATGQCGFDLYVGPPGKQCYHNTTKYDHKQTEYEVLLFEQDPGGTRQFTLFFPLYQGVNEVLVGLDPNAELTPPPPFALERPVVVYGTSITQGGCAARPGMAYTNILSRRLDAAFINLGFSGNGRGEPEVARTLAEISDPALFLLDYEANAGGLEALQRTLPEFIRILREAHRETPILVLSRIRPAREATQPASAQDRERRRDFQRRTVERLREQGDARIFFQDGTTLLGKDFNECTVDGSHPTDLGFWLMANSLEPVLREILF